jgi:sterol 14-demethylase
VENMKLLHACVREALRLRPPLMQLMRRARKDYAVTANGRT